MKDNPFFSIVLPTYNRAHLIAKPIESVLAQTYSNWELIIVDDGSTDNTRHVISEIVDPRIHYLYQKNAERSAARNNGISKAIGTYICFLDSDDSYLPQHLATLYKTIEDLQFPTAMFISGVVRDEPTGMINVPNELITDHINPESFFLMAKESVIPSRVAVHKSILSKFSFPLDIKDVEDTFLWVNIASQYPIIQIPQNTAIYYLHGDNSTNIKRNPFKNQLKGLRRIFNNRDLSKNIPQQIIYKKLSICYHGIAKYHLLVGNYFQMVFNLILSIYYNPWDESTKSKFFLIITKFMILFKRNTSNEKSYS